MMDHGRGHPVFRGAFGGHVCIVLSNPHQHANAPYPLALLRASCNYN
jgi:hypothetical protein